MTNRLSSISNSIRETHCELAQSLAPTLKSTHEIYFCRLEHGKCPKGYAKISFGDREFCSCEPKRAYADAPREAVA